jgi:succinyl-CoA synthetase beta subunit
MPRGIVADTPEGAAAAAAELGTASVVKAQVLTGGRGKAGGVRRVSSPGEAAAAARDILGRAFKGMPATRVLVVEAVDIEEEYYAGFTVDRTAKAPVLIFSGAGGMDIEEVSATRPEKILRMPVAAAGSLDPEPVSRLLSGVLGGGQIGPAADILARMYALFREKDCSLVEVNPLALTRGGQLIAADAKVVIDDNALAKHPELQALRNDEEFSEDEIEAQKAGLSFVSLEGEIGCMVNGAGLAMATMDGIKSAGGTPANFLDVGGSSNPQKVLDAMRILLRNEKLKVILVNIFGGITRCDDVARGILMAREKLHISVPMVIRLTGTNEEKAHAILRDAGLVATRDMGEALRRAVGLLHEAEKA